MLLGFKSRFELYVIEGSKTHTIRRTKKIPPKVGETCHCYGDVRQKTMHLLGRWPCIAIDDILIRPAISKQGILTVVTLDVSINGEDLSADEKETLFYRDGFRATDYPSVAQACNFWRANFADGKPFHGQMIHWDFARPKFQ